ncbi:UNVERIFIED_CONTAM: hypothetical protein GTU68_057525 [Idotea baltica]|nr:hypothetical protein [Idotea baltica]
MSTLARENDAINLSQGFPNFNCDYELRKKVEIAMKKGFNQYAPMQGLAQLREQIARMIGICYGVSYDPATEITVTSGATEALLCAVMALVKEGDEVIVIEPAYDSYLPAIELSGGIPVCISLSFPDYRIDWEQVKRLINHRTRAIILNSPHNPTGTILQDSDLRTLAQLISDKEIYVISDEVYEHIIYDGQSHASVAQYPELAARSFIISSFGKSLHATGWKVGYCVAPPFLTNEFRKIHQYVTFSTSTPFQFAIADYLENNFEKIIGLKSFYQKKRDFFLQHMEGSAFEPIASSGTYFQLMRYHAISDEPDQAFAERLTKEFGVAAIPISVFYRNETDHRVVRFCFAKEDETLEKATERLRQIQPRD